MANDRLPIPVGEREARSVAGLKLPDGSADAITAMAAEVAKSAASLVTRKTVGDTIRVTIKMTPDMRAQLAKGTVRFTETKGGHLAQLRNVADGQIASNLDIVSGLPGTEKVAGLGAIAGAAPAVVWAALAIATQQHYLVEISGKLSKLDASVDELLKANASELRNELGSIERALSLVEDHERAGELLEANDRQDVREWHRRAVSIAGQSLETAKRAMGEGEVAEPRRREVLAAAAKRMVRLEAQDAENAFQALGTAERATAIATRCVAALLRMPYSTATKQMIDYRHYATQTNQMVDDLEAVRTSLAEQVEENVREWQRYRAFEPSRGVRGWDAGPGRVERLQIGKVKKPATNLLEQGERHAPLLSPFRATARPEIESVTFELRDGEARLLDLPLVDLDSEVDG